MVKDGRPALTLLLLAAFVLLAAAIVGAAVGDSFYNAGDWRNLERAPQNTYVAGVIDAYNYVATHSDTNYSRIAQCLDRFQRLGDAADWVRTLAASRASNISMSSIIAVNACN